MKSAPIHFMFPFELVDKQMKQKVTSSLKMRRYVDQGPILLTWINCIRNMY